MSINNGTYTTCEVLYTVWLSMLAFSRVSLSCSLVPRFLFPRFPFLRFQPPGPRRYTLCRVPSDSSCDHRRCLYLCGRLIGRMAECLIGEIQANINYAASSLYVTLTLTTALPL